MSAAEFFGKARALLKFEVSPVGRAWDRGTPAERKALAMIAGHGAYLPEWLWSVMTIDQQIKCRQAMADEWRIHDRAWRELTTEQRQGIAMAAKGAVRWLSGIVSKEGLSTDGESVKNEGVEDAVQ